MGWLVCREASGGGLDPKDPKYRPLIHDALLPLFLIFLFASARVFVGADYARHTLLSVCYEVFLQICIYYAILLPLLPCLRRRISARSCAMLWSIPNSL